MKAWLGTALLGLLIFSVQMDIAVPLGGLTLYHNELLLALLLPAAVWLSWDLSECCSELKFWSLAFLPLGLWLLAHAFGPDSAWGGVKALLRAAQMACGLALPAMLLRDKQALDRALALGLAALLISCLWGLAQSASGPSSPINAGRGSEVFGSFQAAAAGFGHHNQLGAFFAAALCVSLGLLASGRHQGLALLALAACLLGLAESYSRGAWISAAAASICFLPLLDARKRWALLGVGAFLALLAIFGPSEAFRSRLLNLTADGNRSDHFKAAWKLWEGHAFWGWGTEALQERIKAVAESLTQLPPEGRAAFSSHLHNSYLQIGLSWGWPALLGWATYVAAVLRRIAGAWAVKAARPWALGLLAALLAFAMQAGTDLLNIHARGLAISLCWGLLLAGMKLEFKEGRLATLG